jgi:hypothetical protein
LGLLGADSNVSRFSSLSGCLNPIEALLYPPVLVPFNRGVFYFTRTCALGWRIPSIQKGFCFIDPEPGLRREQLDRDIGEVCRKDLCGVAQLLNCWLSAELVGLGE